MSATLLSLRKSLTCHVCTKSGITDLCQGPLKLVSTWPATKYSCSHGNNHAPTRCVATKGVEMVEEITAATTASRRQTVIDQAAALSIFESGYRYQSTHP